MTKNRLREKVAERAKRVKLAWGVEMGREGFGRYRRGMAVLRITLRAAYKAWKVQNGSKIPQEIENKSRQMSHITSVMNALHHLKGLKSTLMCMESSHLSKELAQIFTHFCKEGFVPISGSSRFYHILVTLPGLGGGHQNCSNGFLLKLLAKLDSELACPQPRPMRISPFSPQLEVYQRKKCKELHNLFSALIETVYICSKCFTSWNTFAYSRSISLPIATRCSLINGVTYFSEFAFYDAHLQAKYQSVSQESLGKYAQSVINKSLQRVQPCKLDLCIQSFLKASLDTEEMQDCDVCGGEQPHFRQTFVREIGKELVFHMKRNSISEPGTPIDCPDMLDMGEYVSGGGKYSLSAVVSLRGSVESGQCSTYIKRGERWMLLEGQATRAVSLGSNVLQSPYLLFYSQLA